MLKWSREVLFYMTEKQTLSELESTPNTLNEQFIAIYKKIEAFANKKFNKMAGEASGRNVIELRVKRV